MMSLSEYETGHRNRTNLLIHLIAVPVFCISGFGILVTLASMQPTATLLFLVLSLGALALQGYGHKLEAIPPAPFSSPFDMLKRILIEQYVLFWRLLFSKLLGKQ